MISLAQLQAIVIFSSPTNLIFINDDTFVFRATIVKTLRLILSHESILVLEKIKLALGKSKFSREKRRNDLLLNEDGE